MIYLKGKYDSKILLKMRHRRVKHLYKQNEVRKSRFCSNSILNWLRASYRIISYGNIRKVNDIDIHFIQNKIVKNGNDRELKQLISFH